MPKSYPNIAPPWYPSHNGFIQRPKTMTQNLYKRFYIFPRKFCKGAIKSKKLKIPSNWPDLPPPIIAALPKALYSTCTLGGSQRYCKNTHYMTFKHRFFSKPNDGALFKNKIFMLDLAKHFSICQSFGIRNNNVGSVKREKISFFI